MNKPLRSIGINFYITKGKNKILLSSCIKRPTLVILKNETYCNNRLLKFYIGLALGLIPELTRKDRNVYVKINQRDISSSYKKYYKINLHYHKSFYNTDFDFSSMMLIDPSFENKHINNTTWKSHYYPYYEKSLQLFQYFSFNDLKRLNGLYCTYKCKKVNNCKNGGYYGKKCNVCECLYPFRGEKCEKLIPRYSECSEEDIFNATSIKNVKIIKNTKGLCYFFIKAKQTKKIKMTILDFETNSSEPCIDYAKLEIKYFKDKGARGLILCQNIKNITLPSLSNEVIMFFESFYTENKLTFSYQEID